MIVPECEPDICQWKFFVFRYNANTSESSTINARNVMNRLFRKGLRSRWRCSVQHIGDLIDHWSGAFQRKYMTKLSQLLWAHRTTGKSSPVSKFSIK